MYSGSRSTEGAVSFFSTTPSSARASRSLSKAEKSTTVLSPFSTSTTVTDPLGSTVFSP